RARGPVRQRAHPRGARPRTGLPRPHRGAGPGAAGRRSARRHRAGCRLRSRRRWAAMSRLLAVELRRLFSRGLVVLAMVGALTASLLLLLGVWQSSQPMSDAELAQAEQMYEQELEYWEENGEEAVAQCQEDEAREAELTGEAVDFGCDQMAPQREWYIWAAPPLEDS